MKTTKFKNKKVVLSIATISILIAVLAFYFAKANNQPKYVFETEPVQAGAIINTVTSTGTLEATNTVVVGTQVSGVVEKIYVDFNSCVKKGQLIAELDKSTLQSSLETAEATLYNALAEYEYQKSNLERMQVLNDKNMMAESDYDLVKFNYKKSEASVKSAQANLNKAKRNLSYATIYSPIEGIVINRAVEEGQTVAASMNTPELFTITNDLSVMQVEADVDEADIGMVQAGQRVEFTVDAFPDEIFQGSVKEVRLQPVEISNVVTYTVIIEAQNPKLKLKPGMTASITTYVEEVEDILLLPGKAIRFTPEREVIQAYFKSLGEVRKTGRPNGKNNPTTSDRTELSDNYKRVWVKNGSSIQPIMVETGITDGSNIQIISGLNEYDEVITSMDVNGKENSDDNKTDISPKSPFVQERGKR